MNSLPLSRPSLSCSKPVRHVTTRGNRHGESESRQTQRVSVPHPTVFGWNTLGPGVLYDLVRGDRGALRSTGGMTDLGVVLCVENDSTDVTTRGLSDADVPLPGEAFLYFVRPNGESGYGASTWFEPRVPASGDCP